MHAGTPPTLDHCADRQRVLQHANRLLAARRRGTPPQHAPNFAAGCVARVKNSADRVRAFGREGRPPLLVEIEARAPFEQLARVARPFLDEHTNRALVAKTVARSQRVGRMQPRRIVGADRCRDSTLRVLGIALARIGFRDQDDVAGRRELDGRA